MSDQGWQGWCANEESGRKHLSRCNAMCEHCRRLRGEAAPPGLYMAETISGGFVDLANPDPATITFDDIAAGLSRECRYVGQCSRFYTVAEHACLVAWRLESQGAVPAVSLAGLHHDDAEALTGDITRPLKKLVPAFAEVEERVHEAVAEALGISQLPFHDPAVKEADDWALMREAYELMPSRGCHWLAAIDHPPGPAPWHLGAAPQRAGRMWVAEHVRLKRLVGL